jgi:putative flavoprotein involved in K+ transport
MYCSAPMKKRDAAVIGAGPGGLAVAAMIRRRGIEPLVLERSASVGASWRGHYDRLHLHTVRWLSHLPGFRIPRAHGRWVARDDVVDYLERYARHHELDIELGTEVERLEPCDGGGWRVLTASGEAVEAGQVVVATGYNHTPHVPEFPGIRGFTRDLIHSSQYRNAHPYRGKDVLVVGSGNTGAEIAVDLAEGGAARVRIAIRTPPNIVVRSSAGLPTQLVGVAFRNAPPRLADALLRPVQRLTVGDLSAHGIPRAERGVYTRMREDGRVPIIDVGLVDALKRGEVEVVPGVIGFDRDEVVLAGRARIAPDAVILATGFERGLDRLVGHLDVLDDRGRPLVRGACTHENAPGLYFTGYTDPISGMFRELAIDARRIARAVARSRATAAA